MGRILDLRDNEGGTRIGIDAGRLSEGVVPGDSIAINGCCLTASRIATK